MDLAHGQQPMSGALSVIIAGSVAAALALALVPLARRVALRHAVTDQPEQGRAHRVPTPRLGGVAVLVAVVGATLIAFPRPQLVPVLGAAVLIGLVGLADDLRSLPPSVKLLVESAAAIIVFAVGGRIELFGGIGALVLTVVWLVGLTNAYNLLDNMDGCASSVLAITAGVLMVAGVLAANSLVGVVGAAIAGAAVGFLIYNWHPARIFLGDAGSLFLGFLISAVALMLRFPTGAMATSVALGMIAAPAIFDTTLVIMSRRRARQPIHIGGTDHTSHRLVCLGVPTRWVCVVLGAATTCSGALGLAVARGAIPVAGAAAVFVLVGSALLVRMLRVPMTATSRHIGSGPPAADESPAPTASVRPSP